MRSYSFKGCLVLTALCALFLLAGCGGMGGKGEAKYPTGAERSGGGNQNDIYSEPESVFGPGGLKFLGRGEESEGNGGIGVNSFLWRAALDTVSFMPLASADPFGGVILTDWHAAPETPGERIKLNVFILDRQLRSDGIQVKVFRQVRKGSDWRDADVADDTGRRIEDAILTRARQLRVAQNAADR